MGRLTDWSAIAGRQRRPARGPRGNRRALGAAVVAGMSARGRRADQQQPHLDVRKGFLAEPVAEHALMLALAGLGCCRGG